MESILLGEMRYSSYDPFIPGPFVVGERTMTIHDEARAQDFPCEVWHPAAAGEFPLIVFSHCSGGGRRQSTFLCRHLASHGYLVAALDHAEAVMPSLRSAPGETPVDRMARIQGWIGNRIPDVKLLVDGMLDCRTWDLPARADSARIGIAGHSFGGWTALAVPESDSRVGAIVALAPAGASAPGPGIIPCTLTFAWAREAPVLFIVAREDSALPLSGMHELFERARVPKRMAVLHRADHAHFFDQFERREGQCSSTEAHALVRALSTAHFDATLRGDPAAREFLEGDVRTAMRARDIHCDWA